MAMRITSVCVEWPTFDDDIAILLENKHVIAKNDRRIISRSSVVNLLVRQAAESVRKGLNPITNRTR